MMVTPVIRVSGPVSAATSRGENSTSLTGMLDMLFQSAPAVQSVSNMPYITEGSHSAKAAMLTLSGCFPNMASGSIGSMLAILPLPGIGSKI